MRADGTPLVSVVIPVHDGAHRLPALLRALGEQTASRELYEVIFVDDCSTDRTAELITGSGVASVVSSERRGGSYVARNLGLAHARGEIIAFTDSDCLPAADWIAAGVAEIERTGADLLAGRVEMSVGESPSVAALVDVWRFLDQERWVAQDFGATANLWVRREVIDRVGPFKDLISGGDAEFGHRATGAGARIVYGDSVVVAHPPRARARDLARKAVRTGIGAAQQLRRADGRLRHRGRVWVRPAEYVPHDRVRDLGRITSQGYHPTSRERIAMFWMNYFALKLPHALGNLAGDATEAWRSLVPRAQAVRTR